MDESPVGESGGDLLPEPRPRRSPSLFVLPVVWLALGVAGGFVIVHVVQADDPPPAEVSTEGPTAEAAEVRDSPTPSPTPTPTPTPTAEPTTAATVAPRTTGIAVYNQVGIGGLAARVAGQARSAGWSVVAIGNWRGGVPQDTVYYPPGLLAEAELLGGDIAVARFRPAVPTMSDSHLTVVLADRR